MRTKTTLELEAPVYTRLKSIAAKEGKTLKRLMDELIMLGLKSRKEIKLKEKFILPEGVALKPMVQIMNKEAIQEVLDRENYVLD